MLDDYTVENIYIPIDDYPNILIGAPIGTAIYMMHHVLEDKHKYRNILVLDEDDHLKGYLSIRDLIRAVGPDYLHKQHLDIKGHQPFGGFEQTFSELSLIWQDRFTTILHDELSKPVHEYMTLVEEQVALDDPLAKCIHIMLLRDILMLPVVKEGEVIGVVRLVDLFECIATNVEQVWLPKYKKSKDE